MVLCKTIRSQSSTIFYFFRTQSGCTYFSVLAFLKFLLAWQHLNECAGTQSLLCFHCGTIAAFLGQESAQMHYSLTVLVYSHYLGVCSGVGVTNFPTQCRSSIC